MSNAYAGRHRAPEPEGDDPLTTREIVRGWVAFVLMIVPTVLGFYALANIYG